MSASDNLAQRPSPSGDATMYLDRTDVRSALINYGNRALLRQIDKLSISTAADFATPTPSDNGVHAGMKNKEIKQHISWLYQYMRCMKQENWLDMRDSAERQLERLEAMLSAVPEGKI